MPIECWRRTGGEADQHPSQLVTRSLNLHTQPQLISENSPLVCDMEEFSLFGFL